MAMGIVSDEEFQIDYSKYTDIIIPSIEVVNSVEIIDITKGRGNGNVEVPDSLRKIIGETNELEGRAHAIDLANKFGISSSSVSAYGNGSHSTASYDKRPGLDHINQAKERISKKARNRLLAALNQITPEKLESEKAKDLSSVAKDMSVIIKNMEPETIVNDKEKNSPTFVFYSPQFIKEENFEVIYAKE